MQANIKNSITNTTQTLRAQAETVNPLTATCEFIDNALQQTETDVLVIVNEQDKSISIQDNGTGFNDISWQRYHNVFQPAEQRVGISRYGIGSKCFGAVSQQRATWSVNQETGKSYHSTWDFPQEGYREDKFDTTVFEISENIKKIYKERHKRWTMNTHVILRGVDVGESGSFSSFFSKLVRYSQKRYEYKLHKTGKNITMVFLCNKGKIHNHSTIKPRCVFKTAHRIKSGHVVLKNQSKGINYHTFLDNEVSNGVSKQGIEVYYDDIYITSIDWLKISSNQQISKKAKHNNLNSCRQLVFLSCDNLGNIKINPNKTDISNIERKLKKHLASDFSDLSRQILKQKKDERRKDPSSGVNMGKKFPYKTSDETGIFGSEALQGLPVWEQGGGIFFNEDSVIYEQIVKLDSEKLKILISNVEAMFRERSETKANKRVVTDFLKRYLRKWDVLYDSQ